MSVTRHIFLATLALSTLVLSACQDAPRQADASGSASAPRTATSAGTLTDPASGANCAGQDLRITSDGFSLVIEGECGHVVVTGSNGALNVDRAASIRVKATR